ncbi:MAG: helix-turn-helix domain-containing protein [Pseudomonadota bacterium]
MSHKIVKQRNNVSPENVRLFKSLGSIIKAYRLWRGISQEVFAESIKISVRQLQNWEAKRSHARIENLHDISEFTGIPMQALVSLNSDQPVWYCIRKRRFTYSLIETEQFTSQKLFRPNEKPEDHSFLNIIPIKKEKHLDMILSCHRDLYGTEKTLHHDVFMETARRFPDLNVIIVDYFGHYVGHRICLPLKIDVYQALIKQKTIENYITIEMISDIIKLGEGVFFNYSTFSANVNTLYKMILDGVGFLSKIKQKEKYFLATHTVTKETSIIQNNMQMNYVRNYPNPNDDEVCPVIYETKLDFQLRPDGPFGWMLHPTTKKASTNKLINGIKQKQSPANSIQNSEKIYHPSESNRKSKKTENCSPLIVDGLPLIVDKKKNDKHSEKAETCKNPKCTLYGKIKQGNIVSNGTYRTQKGTPGRRFLCKECGKSFCSRTGTIFYDIRSPEEKVLKALKLLVKGMPVQHVVKLLGVKFHTVRHWLEVAALQKEKINAILINEPDISRAELNTLWDFVKTNSLRKRALLCRAKNKSYATE